LLTVVNYSTGTRYIVVTAMMCTVYMLFACVLNSAQSFKTTRNR